MDLHAPKLARKLRGKLPPAARPRRKLSRVEKAGIGSAIGVVGLIAIGVVIGVVVDRLIDMSDVFDAGGEWDEGGGVHTRWY
ncbi:MAG: hypothetical protein K1X35_10575 [Caulobacteraceae bacterium]|nr:hypothetical protein [Caulobacteraceae bacterium]